MYATWIHWYVLDRLFSSRHTSCCRRPNKHTQDLAQDLPQDAVALELVLERVREHDATVSDEQARTILVRDDVQGVFRSDEVMLYHHDHATAPCVASHTLSVVFMFQVDVQDGYHRIWRLCVGWSSRSCLMQLYDANRSDCS